jgi:hypothetical protein
MLHTENALSHISVITQQFLAKNKMAAIPHPPYSPDLATCDVFLFSKMKLKLKGRRIAESASHPYRKGIPGSVATMEGTVGPVSTCGRELLRG